MRLAVYSLFFFVVSLYLTSCDNTQSNSDNATDSTSDTQTETGISDSNTALDSDSIPDTLPSDTTTETSFNWETDTVTDNDSDSVIATDDNCRDGESRCHGNALLSCFSGNWVWKMNCADQGAECQLINGSAFCVVNFDSDTTTDDSDSVSDDSDSATDDSDSASDDSDSATDDSDSATDDSDSVTDDSDSATDDSDSATDDSDSVTDDSDSATDDSDSVTDDSDSSFEDDVEPLEKRDCGSLEDVYPGGNMTFRLNHLGFDADGGKEIVIETSDALDSFQVVDENQKVAACGELVSVYFNEWGGGPNYYVAEFSYLQTPGTYRILAGGTYSEAFVIEENLLFGETVSDVLSCFYLSRADHPNVVNADTQTPKYGSGGKIDVHGGWYDASGDISKYLSHLSYANFLNPQQIPLVVWALAYAHNEASAHLNRLGKSDAVLAEALYGADYLVRILDPAGYFYMNVFDNWTGDLNQREICAFEGEDGYKTSEYQAAFREGGGMTIAALARVSTFGQNGDFTPSDYLWAAKTGFDHLEANGPNYCDDGKENIIDDYTALLAATELFKATFDPNYLDAARARAINLSQRLSADGYFIADDGNRPFWHASDAGLPVVALARYASVETDDVYRSEALNTIETHMAWQLTLTNAQANPYGYARQTFHSGGTVQDGFFIPHDNETNYWWQGENARLASLAAAFVIGGRAIGQKGHYHGVTKSDAIFAANQVDWILGKNPYDICFMKGFGRNNPPAYQGEKTEFGQRAHDGGISNGITGKQTNGAGIQWNPNPPRDEWGNQMWWLQWRWVEQWLPHATWYLIATAAMTQE